jgi:hypothetical protein
MTLNDDKQRILGVLERNGFDAIVFNKHINVGGRIGVSKVHVGKRATIIIIPEGDDE